MPMIYEIEQGSPEWFKARLGIPTASQFGAIVKRLKSGGYSKERTSYLYQLAGEIITGEVVDTYSGGHLARGKAMEAQARDLYAFSESVEVTPVGFVRSGRAGASPDGLVGANGTLEVKTKLPHLLIESILGEDTPEDHVAQVQGQIWVSEREWCDFVAYWPGMPIFVKRAYRDAAYIANLEAEVERFNDELDRVVEKIRRYGNGEG